MRAMWKTIWGKLIGIVGICLCIFHTQLAAQERKPSDWNAAVGYWQAFALMPILSEQERKLIESISEKPAEPLADSVRGLTEQGSAALAAMAAAGRIKRCDWQLNYADGPNLLLPHLQKGRDLARLANVRARYRFSVGDRAGAIEDVESMLRLARAAGTDPLLIGLMVGAAIESLAIDTLAAYLPDLTEKERGQVVALWNDLPSRSRSAAAIQMERKIFGGWLEAELERATRGKSPEDSATEFYSRLAPLFGSNPRSGTQGLEVLERVTIAEAGQALAAYIDRSGQLGAILELPFAERYEKLCDFEKASKEAAESGTAVTVLPALFLPPDLVAIADREESWATREILLTIALAGVASGKEGIESAAKERGVDLVCEEQGGAWKLSSPLTPLGKVETLTVGGGIRAAK